MTLAKNTTAILAVLMLLMVFTFMSAPAYAAPQERTDVCETEDVEEVDDEEDDEEDDENDAEDQCEQAESKRLESQAKISESEARAIALKKHSGTVKEILLAEDEDDAGTSRIVYEIEIVDGNKTEIDVKINAETGAYLGVDDDEDDGESDDEIESSSQNTQVLQTKLISLLQQLIVLLKAQ